MLASLFFSLLSLSCHAQLQTNGRFIHDNSLGEVYPYAVALPQNNDETLPPAVLMLGGKGSVFEQGVTFPIDSTVSYGGVGWRASRYMNGSREAGDVLLAENFVSIIPYVHGWETDSNGEYNLSVDGVMAVINDARTKYPIDPNRIYLSGYSAGARAIWDILPAYPNYFAAASVCAGVPQPQDFSGLPNMLNVPLQIYTGTADYDAFSQEWMAQAYQYQIQNLGGTQSQLITLQGVDHNDMQQVPYDVGMFNFFLNNTNAQATPDQVSAALAPNPSASQLYSSILSYEYAYESVYSASLYADGLPPSERPMVPQPTTTMAPLSLASGVALAPTSSGATIIIDDLNIKAASDSAAPARQFSLPLTLSLLVASVVFLTRLF